MSELHIRSRSRNPAPMPEPTRSWISERNTFGMITASISRTGAGSRRLRPERSLDVPNPSSATVPLSFASRAWDPASEAVSARGSGSGFGLGIDVGCRLGPDRCAMIVIEMRETIVAQTREPELRLRSVGAAPVFGWRNFRQFPRMVNKRRSSKRNLVP